MFPLCSLFVLINSLSSRVSSFCVEVLCYLFIFILSWGNVYMCVALCSRFLIDRGADLSLVNNDGDLAIDIADSDEMEMLLQQEIESRGKCEVFAIQLLYISLNLLCSYEFVSLHVKFFLHFNLCLFMIIFLFILKYIVLHLFLFI